MKNLLKKIILFNIGLILFSVPVNGEEKPIIVITNSTVSEKSPSGDAEIQFNNIEKYNKVEFSINKPEDITIVSVKPIPASGTDFSKDDNNITYSFENKNGLPNASIGTISYTINNINLDSTYRFVATEIKLYKIDENGEYILDSEVQSRVQEGKITIEKEKSKDATLTNLTVSQGTLNPAFKKDVVKYEVKVADTINTIRLDATPAKGATLPSNALGFKTLNMGENTFEIEVTAEDGKTKNTYTINVIKGEIVKPSAYLKSLSLNNIGVKLSPEFEKNNNKYTVEVPKSFNKLNIEYTKEEEASTIEIKGNENFQIGENKITITVTSSDEKEKQEYEIIVNKKGEEETPSVVPNETEPKKENKKKINLWLLIGIGLGILLLIIGTIILLFRKKKMKVQNVPKLKETKPNEDESVTDILKKDLFEDEKTTTYNVNEFNKVLNKAEDPDDLEKTKEFKF